MEVKRLSSGDPNSFSTPENACVTHIHLNLNVDFSKKVLSGFAELTVKIVKADVKELILDTNQITIHSITSGDGCPLKYSLGEPVMSFGCKLAIILPEGCGNDLTVKINYTTSRECTALEWLDPEQTAGKKHPYVFSQCEAIYCRFMVPCQDTPAVKTPYTATITAPSELTVLMSAVKGDSEPFGENLTAHSFRQSIPVPSYLIAIAVGALESKRVGPRTRVWSEKELVDKAAWEFAETEDMLKTAESIVGPYEWGDYDILVLPPSFAFGGMENPCLTFATPTILAGDRSLATVITHEISHSWTGNLVTNANFEHFWLNEGFTMFLERKIRARMYGEEDRHFCALEGIKLLRDDVNNLGETNPLTRLVPDLTGVDPEDAFCEIPYEKGHTFLFHLEEKLGGSEKFDKFLYAYVQHFKYKSIRTEDFKDFLFDYFKEEIKAGALDDVCFDDWFYTPGMPIVIPKYNTALAQPCIDLCEKWTNWSSNEPFPFGENDISGFNSNQLIEFLSLLLEEAPLSVDKLKEMERLYKLNARRNSEIRFKWLRLCLRGQWKEQSSHVVEFLSEQGRLKYIKPLYRDLYCWEETRQLALDTFNRNRNSMMLLSVSVLSKELKL